MVVRSLAFRTDLFFARFDGEVIDRGDHLVVVDPANPTYWWGNFVLFARPPRDGDLTRWQGVFEAEVATRGGSDHVAFGIDGTDGDPGRVRAFLDDGFRLERGVVLASPEVREPPRPNAEVRIRPLQGDREWEAATLEQIRALPERQRSEAGARFKRRQMARYRAMSRAGRGEWFGAFLDGTLVADLGVFHQDGIARFQSVVTDADHRRRGICGTLVHHAARHAFDVHGVETVVIVADEGSSAARVYASVGLVPTETTLGLIRPGPADR